MSFHHSPVAGFDHSRKSTVCEWVCKISYAKLFHQMNVSNEETEKWHTRACNHILLFNAYIEKVKRMNERWMNEWKKEIQTVSLGIRRTHRHTHTNEQGTFLSHRSNLHIISCHLRLAIKQITNSNFSIGKNIDNRHLFRYYRFFVHFFVCTQNNSLACVCVCVAYISGQCEPCYTKWVKEISRPRTSSLRKRKSNCKFSFDNGAIMILLSYFSFVCFYKIGMPTYS